MLQLYSIGSYPYQHLVFRLPYTTYIRSPLLPIVVFFGRTFGCPDSSLSHGGLNCHSTMFSISSNDCSFPHSLFLIIASLQRYPIIISLCSIALSANIPSLCANGLDVLPLHISANFLCLWFYYVSPSCGS